MSGLFLLGYLDPGSGSMLLQLLVGGIAGAGVVIRFYGRSFLYRITGNREIAVEPAAEEHELVSTPSSAN